MKGRCYSRRFLAKLGGLVFVFLPVAPTDSYAQPAPMPASVNAGQGDFAGLVEIDNGRRLYLECRGVGSPTVILESGTTFSDNQFSRSDPVRCPVQFRRSSTIFMRF
jgi:hypothetical protein